MNINQLSALRRKELKKLLPILQRYDTATNLLRRQLKYLLSRKRYLPDVNDLNKLFEMGKQVEQRLGETLNALNKAYEVFNLA